VGTSKEHYRTYNIWIKETRAIQNCDTVFFKHKHLTNPTVTKADIVTNAANKLIDSIKGNFASVHNDNEIEALDRLSKIFVDATKRISGATLEEPAAPPRVEETANSTPSPRVDSAPSPRVDTMPKEDEAVPNLVQPDEYDSSDDEDEIEPLS
jgi:hypothetical protein